IRHTPMALLGDFGLPGRSDPIQNPKSKIQNPEAPLLLQDIATVTLRPAERETITRVNGQESIGLIIMRSPDANTVAVAQGLRQALEGLRPELMAEAGASVTILRDQSIAVADALEDIN